MLLSWDPTKDAVVKEELLAKESSRLKYDSVNGNTNENEMQFWNERLIQANIIRSTKERYSTVTFDHCNPLNELLKVKLGWAPSPEADTEDFSSPRGKEDGPD